MSHGIRPALRQAAAASFTTLVATCGLATSGAVAATRHAAVDGAQASVVRVLKPGGQERSAAFAINTEGEFLTTTQSVSRSTGLKVLLPGSQKQWPATKVSQSDAPPGLALIQVKGAPKLPVLKFSKNVAKPFEQTWVVPPHAVLGRPRGASVDPAQQGCTESKTNVMSVEARRAPGMNGSPVVDDNGDVVGVVRANRIQQGCPDAGIQVVQANYTPAHLPPIPPPKRANFPAIPVVVGLAILLLIANVVRRVRGAGDQRTAVVSVQPRSEPAVVSRTVVDDDDLGIRLRPKPPR